MRTLILRHNLPTEPNTLIGRDAEVSGLRQRLAETRVATLCGAGGIGKSRLALHLAGDLLRDFDDGVWLIELASLRRPSQIAERMAETIGIDIEPGTTSRDAVVEALRYQRVLLVLDNCEHLIEPCAELAQALVTGGTHLRILATSREPLRVPGESVWRVPPLDLPVSDDTGEAANCAALRLFAERAAAVRRDFAITPDNARQVAALCRTLDGMPLAIELAAARVGVLSVDQITARLADRFRLLTANNRLAPARQQTLRATVEWSYELLTEAEQTLLRRLAVFADGWTLEMAEYVCSDGALPDAEVLDLTASLVDKSLVTLDREVAGELRYRLLETIRAYAAERLDSSGEEPALRTRHRDHLTRLAADASELLSSGAHPWTERLRMAERITAEEENVRAALAWSLKNAEAEPGLRLCVAMRWFWILLSRYAEGRSWMRRLLALDPEGTAVSAATRAAALTLGSGMATEDGELEEAKRLASDGLDLAQEAVQPYYAMLALHSLGLVALRRGQLDAAEDYCSQSLAAARQAAKPFEEGAALGTLGAIAAARGQFQTAQRWLDSALEVHRRMKHHWAQARIVEAMGYLAELRGDPDAALRRYEDGLELLRGFHSPQEDSRSLLGIARLATDRGDFDRAQERLTECLLLCRQSGRRLGIARSLEVSAQLAYRRRRLPRALRLVGAADTLREALGRPRAAASGRIAEILDAARRDLGGDSADRFATEGRGLTVEDAVRYATGPWEDPDEPAAPAPFSDAPDRAEPLTPREREIAALVARGLTNRGIAEELFISQATAARHIANILTKLGFNSRTQIALWAADQRLKS